MRSMLFVPADSERKIAKSADIPADGLILDLEDSVVPARKDIARQLTAEYLDARPPASRTQKILVRINPLSGDMTLDDLSAIVRGVPDVVIMPKYRTPEDVQKLDHYLTALEVREGAPHGHIKLLIIATETAQGVLNIAGLTGVSDRLSHVSWGEYDLGADVGAQDQFLDDGSWDDLYRTARALALAGAVSAGAEPCNTVFTDYKDPDGLRRAAMSARRAGFTCMMAIHPNQVEIINEAFSISQSELTWSQRVIEAFDASPDIGVVGLDGIMLDKPHYTQAKRIVARAAAQAN
jgi:citrate lyase subunit beta / citryl-CoA lyase